MARKISSTLINKANRKRRIVKWVLISIGIIGVVWAAIFAYILWFDWVYIIHGPEYQAVEKRCGHKPVITTTDLAGAGSFYLLPADSAYQGPIGGVSFCTEQEAIDKGFKHDPTAEIAIALKKCKGAPVLTHIGYDMNTEKNIKYYQMPASIHSYPGPISNQYFCSEQQAIAAGYVKDPVRKPYN